MCESATIPENRNAFWNDYRTFGFDELCKKYAPVSVKERIKIALDKMGVLNVIRRIRGLMIFAYFIITAP